MKSFLDRLTGRKGDGPQGGVFVTPSGGNSLLEFRSEAEPEPLVRVRGFGPLKRAAEELRAATLGTAATVFGVTLDDHVLAALNGDQIARDPLEPLAEGDEVALMAADAGG